MTSLAICLGGQGVLEEKSDWQGGIIYVERFQNRH